MSRSLRVATVALLLVLLVFAAASAITYGFVRDTVIGGLNANLRHETERNLASVQQSIEQLLLDVRIWSGGHLVSDLLVARDGPDRETAKEEFALIGRSRSTLAELVAFDLNGRVVLQAHGDGLIGSHVPTELLDRVLIGDIYRAPVGTLSLAGRSGLTYATPLRATDGSRVIVGGLVAVVGLSEIQRLFSGLQVNGLPQGEGRRYLVTDDQSRVIYDTVAPQSQYPRWVRTDPEGLAADAVVSRARSRWLGEFGDPGWTLTALVDRSLAFASVDQMGRMMMLSSAIVLIAAGLAGIVMFRRFMSSEAAREEDRIRALADAPVEGIVICDGTTVIDANKAFEDLVGMDRRTIVNQSFLTFVRAADQRTVQGVLLRNEQATEMVDLVAQSGAICPVELIRRPSDARSGGTGTIIAVRDISERTAAQSRIAYMAHHDMLTELANRTKLGGELEAALRLARQNDTGVALYYVDLDHFKSVNDRLGHAGGDSYLRLTAQRLRAFVGANGFAARLGGDEFVVVQTGLSPEVDPSEDAARLCRVLSERLDVAGRQFDPSASIGVATYPADARDSDELLRCADLALYRAKLLGRGTFFRFEASLARAHDERRVLQNELASALDEGQLWLAFQPQASCDGGEVVGFEVLARWTHPELGAIPPSAFIPVAEETGLILRMGDWMLRSACREAASWRLPLDIAVNVSPVQIIQDDLPGRLHEILLETGLDPSRLELEITESVLIHDINRALHILRRLKALGIRIAMDDFGTGYSSLRYLQAFPFDRLKIDRSFISGLAEGEHGRTIVRAAVSLGRGLGLQVLAEGVETEEQWDLLKAERCDAVQGYLFGRPAPITEWRGLTVQPVTLPQVPDASRAVRLASA